MTLALTLMDLAVRLLPDHRQGWGEAMRQELQAILAANEATEFAWGCLWAALKETVTHMNLFVTIGRWGVGAVTAAYGAFHLYGFANGLAMALGKPNPYYSMLVAHHHVREAADYQAFFPLMLLYMLGMGLFNLTAAYFLIRWRAKPFLFACLGVAVVAGALTAYGMISALQSGGLGKTCWGWQFVPLAMLMGAGLAFSWLNNRKPLAFVAN